MWRATSITSKVSRDNTVSISIEINSMPPKTRDRCLGSNLPALSSERSVSIMRSKLSCIRDYGSVCLGSPLWKLDCPLGVHRTSSCLIHSLRKWRMSQLVRPCPLRWILRCYLRVVVIHHHHLLMSVISRRWPTTSKHQNGISIWTWLHFLKLLLWPCMLF